MLKDTEFNPEFPAETWVTLKKKIDDKFGEMAETMENLGND